MNYPRPIHVTVCVCTHRRPDGLRRLMNRLREQRTEGVFTYSVVVVDNDAGQSAEPIVEECRIAADFPVVYGVEPRKNIALARNRAIQLTSGEFTAFIDDDEFPSQRWLLTLLEACRSGEAAGVLGPVLPHFTTPPPRWVRQGRFFARPRLRTGIVLPWSICRTGNVLVRNSIFDSMDEPPFRSEFGTGGEDQDFFRRMMQKGHVFIWSDEAVVYETVPSVRWDVRVMASRALLRGRNTLKHQPGRLRGILKSCVALPLYATALPLLLLYRRHLFIRYLVKCCDHAGKLLAFLGLNPVRERRA